MSRNRPQSRSAKRARGPAAPRGGGNARGGPAERRSLLRLARDPLAIALVALALAVRLWGVADRLPDPTLGINVLDDSVVEETDRTTMGRAWNMWGGGTKKLDLNPHTGGWPALSFYFGLALQMGYKATFVATHPGSSPSDFATHVRDHSDRMFLFGRMASVLVAVATVFLTILMGARLVGRAAGLLAGLFLALNPLHIMTSQHIADPNLLALLFVLLAALAIVRVAEAGSTRSSVVAGVMIGLAGACKYVPLILVIPLAFAHGRGFWRSGGFYFGAIAAGIALVAASPYTFLDWRTTLQDIATQRSALFSDWVGQTAFPFSLPTYLAVSLPHAMGWPAYLLGLMGMGLFWRERRTAHAIALIPAVMVLSNGALKAAQERYMLVALPVLFIGTALTVLKLLEWVRARGAARAPAAAALVGALALAWPLPEYIATRRVLALPDTRHLARRWIQTHIPWDRPMAVELYGPVFTLQDRAMLIWPFFATRTHLVRPVFHYQFLDGLDYIVLSREISRRFDADSANYPVESAYYRWIRANAPVAWRTDPRTTSGPPIEIRRVPRGISTREERDSLFAATVPEPTGVSRVALWCQDFAAMFARLGQYERTEEWAIRGLQVGAARFTQRLCATLAFARLNLQDFAGAEEAARLGLLKDARDPNLRIYRATALQEMGRREEALQEFELAYQVSGDPRHLLHVALATGRLGRYDEAVRLLDQIPRNHPDAGGALQEKGTMLINFLQRVPEGIAALREAAALTPDREHAAMILAEASRIETLASRGARIGRTVRAVPPPARRAPAMGSRPVETPPVRPTLPQAAPAPAPVPVKAEEPAGADEGAGNADEGVEVPEHEEPVDD